MSELPVCSDEQLSVSSSEEALFLCLGCKLGSVSDRYNLTARLKGFESRAVPIHSFPAYEPHFLDPVGLYVGWNLYGAYEFGSQ